jgi:hypothetical protein
LPDYGLLLKLHVRVLMSISLLFPEPALAIQMLKRRLVIRALKLSKEKSPAQVVQSLREGGPETEDPAFNVET